MINPSTAIKKTFHANSSRIFYFLILSIQIYQQQAKVNSIKNDGKKYCRFSKQQQQHEQKKKEKRTLSKPISMQRNEIYWNIVIISLFEIHNAMGLRC